MKPLSFTALVVSLLLNTAHSTARYNERPKNTELRQIAIIGAGAAGSTTASFLQKYAEESGISINVTIFEKTDRIGGRTLTVNPYNDPSIRLELGASIFIEKNQILHDSLAEFNLSKRDPDADSETTLGIWDGDEFVFTIDQKDSYWWNAGKAILRYGFLAPRRTQKLMETTIDKFLKLYEEPHFPFSSLTAAVHKLGLLPATGQTGEQLLKENNVGDLYAHDIIQASTRVNYASNLAAIHGLDTMVSMAPEGAMAVEGGNWQIFHKMVEKSGANLVLNTSIISIELSPPKHGDLENNNDRFDPSDLVIDHADRWSLNSEGKYRIKSDREAYSTEFDHIVMATPYQFSNISLGHGVVQRSLEKIPYVKLHVTLFATPLRFSPLFFGKKEGESLPATVLTTLSKDDAPTPGGVQGAGKAGFFSISTLRKTVNPNTNTEEYLYKIFSPEKVTPEFLGKLFGVPVPETFVDQNGDVDQKSPITWYYPHVFHSYPKALPCLTFQDPIVGKEVYYTSGMESFISTMETNALMGKNVARLIVDSILREKKEESVRKEGEEVVVEEVFKGKIECDRGRGEGWGVLKSGEKPKTRPVQPVFEDL